jgi:hypothetical protein
MSSDWNGEDQAASQTTPNGWEIVYEPKPKRLYRVQGTEVPSVTEILRILDKPALSWWGQCIGISGLLQLRQMGLDIDTLIRQKPPDLEWDEYAKMFASGPLNDNKLTTNHVRDKAGMRGKSVHDALNRYAVDGVMPNPREYPEHEQGYVIGLVAFLMDTPSLEPQAAELMVGSREHGFAGRYDLRARTSRPHRVVTKVYPKKPAVATTMPAGTGLFDLKTSVDVFPENGLQLGAYEMASTECGHDETDYQVVIQFGKDGRYQARRSTATGKDFLAIKGAWEAYRRVEENLKIPYNPKGHTP